MKYSLKPLLSIIGLGLTLSALGQSNYWQQHVDYKMNVELDVNNHQFTGTQELTYTNNSPDTLRKAYYHLYFNAFQPGSQMDVRSLNIKDPDRRVGDRISKLNNDEIGYQKIITLNQDGKPLSWEVIGTVLKVTLNEPILPGQKTQFNMKFEGQVPLQIRRSGRDNKEGIDYSMTQWYPKLAEYDKDGWHPDQYIGREFYGVWGNFDVSITLDSDYMVGGTGYLANANEIGKGYADVKTPNVKKLTWNFKAENVHDFAWAADPDYKHTTVQVENGPLVHFFYDPKTANEENWEKLPEYMNSFFHYMDSHFGKYPYSQFSVIQGGDGGMEYPMATLILGGGNDFKGFVGLFAHEAGHSWYYGLLGSNENKSPWMDEGFTSFAEEMVMMHMFEEKGNPFVEKMAVYNMMVERGLIEPLTTPADHYDFNFTYSVSSYYSGSLFLYQLKGIVGDEAFLNGMLKYYDQWVFKHPTSHDFIRIMEKTSNMELDWYLTYWTELTKTIDYGILKVVPFDGNKTKVTLLRKGKMPMPIDVTVIWKTGDKATYTIPLVMMYNFKHSHTELPLKPWAWTHPTYDWIINGKLSEIAQIIVDGEVLTCDVDRSNNVYPQKDDSEEMEKESEE